MKKILCSKIIVDCIENDIVDIRCGGPAFLGFDFYVKSDEVGEMIKFIKEALKEFEIPLINIGVGSDVMLPVKHIFTKERIVACIKNDSAYLKEEYAYKKKFQK